MYAGDLKKVSDKVRLDILQMLQAAGTGHPGGALSMVEILTVLYFDQMRIRPEEPKWEGRDRFILSKGHGAPALYAVLAERGYFPVEELKTLRKFGSRLQGHPDMKSTPGLDMSSGSLGQGVSIANGMALAAKLKGEKHRIYVLIGDGEVQEGQIWEAAMSAAHYQLDNVTLIVDYNGLQINGANEAVMNIAPLSDKFSAFGWHVLQVDGHDFEAIAKACLEAASCKGRPTVIIAKTVKGKGISYMENDPAWHGNVPNEDQFKQAFLELGGTAK